MNNEQERRTMAVLEQVFQERARQEQLLKDGKFPFSCSSKLAKDEEKFPIVIEEIGEIARELNDKGPHYRKRLRTEIIQAAATLTAWAESLSARPEGPQPSTKDQQ
jgi:hypothetical protein